MSPPLTSFKYMLYCHYLKKHTDLFTTLTIEAIEGISESFALTKNKPFISNPICSFRIMVAILNLKTLLGRNDLSSKWVKDQIVVCTKFLIANLILYSINPKEEYESIKLYLEKGNPFFQRFKRIKVKEFSQYYNEHYRPLSIIFDKILQPDDQNYAKYVESFNTKYDKIVVSVFKASGVVVRVDTREPEAQLKSDSKETNDVFYILTDMVVTLTNENISNLKSPKDVPLDDIKKIIIARFRAPYFRECLLYLEMIPRFLYRSIIILADEDDEFVSKNPNFLVPNYDLDALIKRFFDKKFFIKLCRSSTLMDFEHEIDLLNHTKTMLIFAVFAFSCFQVLVIFLMFSYLLK